MIRCKSLSWSLFLWTLVFLYTWFEFNDFKSYWKVLPVAFWSLAASVLIVLLAKDAPNKKFILMILSWSIVVSIGLILKIFDVINAIALNIHVSVMTGIVAIVWCITSHAEHVTEAGLHWYIWFLLVILTLCCTFNTNDDTAKIIYVIAAASSFITHVIYIWHVFRVQTSGQERCQHVFRTMSCFTLTTFLLISAILLETDSITREHWQDLIYTVEILVAIVIITDSIIGFTNEPIKHGYTTVSTDVV